MQLNDEIEMVDQKHSENDFAQDLQKGARLNFIRKVYAVLTSKFIVTQCNSLSLSGSVFWLTTAKRFSLSRSITRPFCGSALVFCWSYKFSLSAPSSANSFPATCYFYSASLYASPTRSALYAPSLPNNKEAKLF